MNSYSPLSIDQRKLFYSDSELYQLLVNYKYNKKLIEESNNEDNRELLDDLFTMNILSRFGNLRHIFNDSKSYIEFLMNYSQYILSDKDDNSSQNKWINYLSSNDLGDIIYLMNTGIITIPSYDQKEWNNNNKEYCYIIPNFICETFKYADRWIDLGKTLSISIFDQFKGLDFKLKDEFKDNTFVIKSITDVQDKYEIPSESSKWIARDKETISVVFTRLSPNILWKYSHLISRIYHLINDDSNITTSGDKLIYLKYPGWFSTFGQNCFWLLDSRIVKNKSSAHDKIKLYIK